MHRTLRLSLWALTCLALCASAAKAEDFYRGKTITLLVGNTAGGGYDFYARMLVRTMGKYIPGEPSFIVKNQAGAGGKVLANELYSKTTPDGLTFGMLARDNPIEPLMGVSGARFKSEEFTWIGTMSSYADDAYCLVVRADSPIKSIEDARKAGPPLVFGGLAFGESSADIVLLAR